MPDLLGLGRRHAPDPRDQEYPLRQRVERAPEPDKHYRYWWNLGARLDQGATGTCVAHAWVHLAENSPITRPGTLNPYELYREIVLVDEWSDNDHEAQIDDDEALWFGSSVRAGAKVMQSRGLVSTYEWAWNVETITQALLTLGPVVLGTIWTRAMFNADSKGLIEVDLSSGVVGGHAYLADGVNLKNKVIRCLNSWGPEWGKNGYFYLSFDDLAILIEDDGEACMPVEVASV